MPVNTRTLQSYEFVSLVLVVAGSWLVALASSSVGSNSAVYMTAAAAGVYALARGLAKVNHDRKDWWHTSEIPVVVIAALTATVSALHDTINTHTYGVIIATLVAAGSIANGLRKVPAVQAAPPAN